MDPLSSLVVIGAATLFIGGPSALFFYSRWAGKRDDRFVKDTSLEEFWRRAEVTAEEQARFTLIVMHHHYLGSRWNIIQDGHAAGYMELGTRVGEGSYHCDFCDDASWIASYQRSGGEHIYKIHMRKSGQYINVRWWFQNRSTYNVFPGKEFGEDDYEVHVREKRSELTHNGQRIGVYYKDSVDVRVVAIDKSVPSTIKALLCQLISF